MFLLIKSGPHCHSADNKAHWSRPNCFPRHNEWVTAYGGKSGEMTVSPLDLCESLALKHVGPYICDTAPFSLGGPAALVSLAADML